RAFLVGALVVTEPDVAVGAVDVRLAEGAGQFRRQRLQRLPDVLLVTWAVDLPERLAVVQVQVMEVLEPVGMEAGERRGSGSRLGAQDAAMIAPRRNVWGYSGPGSFETPTGLQPWVGACLRRLTYLTPSLRQS